MSIKIRFARPEDAAGIVAIYGPYCDGSVVSFELAAPTVEQMRERIERIIEAISVARVRDRRRSCWLCVCLSASRAGRLSLGRRRRRLHCARAPSARHRPGALLRSVSHSSRRRVTSKRMPASRCRIPAASACTKPSVSGRWPSIAASATNSANGSMSVGGSSICGRNPKNRRSQFRLAPVAPSDSLKQAMLAAEKLVKPRRE